MKQLVILSGKGGTGKTSLTAAFAHLASQGRFAGKVILADADVDAANLELVLKTTPLETAVFKGGKVAIIDQESCIGCGICQQVCRFDAINVVDGRYIVDPIACDGCSACFYQCPVHCIQMEEQVAGTFYASESGFGPVFHADLYAGQENSGKLVTLVKQRARLKALDDGYDLVIVDGPPGIGCPVISAVSGADLALVVAEPTVSGTQDMTRALETLEHFGVPRLVCINKADISPEGTRTIERFCEERGISMVGHIPFDLAIPKALVAGKAITEYDPNLACSLALREIWEKVSSTLMEKA